MPFNPLTQYPILAQPPAQSAQPGATYESPWHQGWSEPVRQKIAPLLAAALVASGAFAPVFAPLRDIGVAAGSWSQPPAQVRQVQYQAWTAPVFTGEAATADKWYIPLSEPVRVKPRLPEGEQQFLAYSESAQFPESVTEDRWHQPWSEPPVFLVKRALPSTEQHYFEFEPEPPVYDATPWFVPLTEPVRVKSLLPTTEQHFFEFEPAPPVFDSVPWFAPLTEPVRIKARLLEALQQFQPDNPFGLTQPESITESRWHQPWSEPVRFKPDLGAPRQLAFATDQRSLTQGETVTESRWHQPWSEPVRVAPRLVTGAQQFLAQAPVKPDVSFSWFNRLNEPVRVPARLHEARQQYIAFTAGAIVIEPTLYSKFAYAWSEPVRRKARLPEPEQHYFEFEPEPPVFDSVPWFAPLSEPVRLKPRLIEARQHYFEFAPLPLVSFGWFGWLSEPVRVPARLLEASQQFKIINEGLPPPPQPGAGRRRDFPSWIPQPPYEAKPAQKPFRPVWDKGPQGEVEQHPTPPAAQPVPLPPASIFAPAPGMAQDRPMPVPGSPPPFGLPDFNNLVPPDPVGFGQRLKEAQDVSDAIAVLKALGLIKEG